MSSPGSYGSRGPTVEITVGFLNELKQDQREMELLRTQVEKLEKRNEQLTVALVSATADII